MKTILQKDITKIVLYLVGAVLLGALLSPALFWGGRWLAGVLEGGALLDIDFFEDMHQSIAESPFRRYFNRAVLVAALLLAWPTYRWLKAGGEMGMGLRRDRRRGLHFVGAFLLGTASLLIMGGLYLRWGWWLPEPDPKPWGALLLGAVTSGLVVAMLEEFFFRGILTGLVMRTVGSMPALVFVAAFFAMIHFMSPPHSAVVEAEAVGWTSGLWMVGKVFAEFTKPSFFFASFMTLFVLGLVLGWARHRTGSLWLPIGLHFGIVFGMKIFTGIAEKRGRLKRGDFMPWAGEDITVGLMPLIVLAIDGLLIVLCLRLFSRRAKG